MSVAAPPAVTPRNNPDMQNIPWEAKLPLLENPSVVYAENFTSVSKQSQLNSGLGKIKDGLTGLHLYT